MRIIIFIMFLTQVLIAQKEIALGNLTYYFFDGRDISKEYKVGLADDNKLIYNPMIGYREIKENSNNYKSFTIFGGRDSIGAPIGGLMASKGKTYDIIFLGIAGSIFFNDDREWEDKGICQPGWVGATHGIGIMAIVGLEANIKLQLSEDRYLKINNYITPAMSTHFISIQIGI